MSLESFLLDLIVILVTAKLFGQLMQRLGQPFVLGELLGGALIGMHGLGLLGESEVTELLARIGLIILLFEIGLETDLDSLIKLGSRSLLVALIGIVFPLAGGYFFCSALGLPPSAGLLVGGAFSATSIGISVRSLAEFGEHKSTEGNIVLGAALIDDVIGLLLLAIVTAVVLHADNSVNSANLLGITVLTLLFPVAAIGIGSALAKPIIKWVDRMTVRGAIVIISLVMAFAFAYLASLCGTSPIIGAFTAGLILARTHRADEIETQLKPIADFFTPIFFVTIGAALNIQLLNPLNANNHEILWIAAGAALIAIGTKFFSGLGALGQGLRWQVIGISMVPRGEVALIFANLGLAEGLINDAWFAVIILMIFATAMSSPAILKIILGREEVKHVHSYSELPLPGFESEERL